MAKVKTKAEEAPIPRFDPQQTYVWKPEDTFELTGVEFEILNKALKANLNDPAYHSHVLQHEGLKVLGELFTKGIEQGVIVPQEPNPQPEEEIETAVV